MSSPPKYLFDECLGANMMHALRDAVSEDSTFTHICEIYGQGREDKDWIPELAAEGGWIVITSDNARKSNPGGKLPTLCKEHKVTHILLSRAVHQLKATEKLATLVQVWPLIAASHNEPPGTRFKLPYVQRPKKQGLDAVLLKIDHPAKKKSKRVIPPT